MFGLTYKQQDELAEFIADQVWDKTSAIRSHNIETMKEIFKKFTREQVKRIAKNEVKQ